MATIAWDGKDGNNARITFRVEGRQKSLRLGKCTLRTAQNALTGFERVQESHRTGSTIHPDGLRWLESIDDTLHARVARLGLTEPRQGAAVVTLGALLKRVDEVATVKASTRCKYLQIEKSLRGFFGSEKPLKEITLASADEWLRWLSEGKPSRGVNAKAGRVLAKATVAKQVLLAKGVFKKAVRWGVIASNPFEELRVGSQSNPARQHYVSVETIDAVLDACPDAEWRAIVCLSRFAGLRCPSEIQALKWGDLNWETQRLTVRSPKTERFEGHGVRVVPVADGLLRVLQVLFDHADEGAVAMFPRLQGEKPKNVGTTFKKIVLRAGVTPWPKLIHNMRASCEMDWVESFPTHVAAKWCGHSLKIAAQHYLQTRDLHFVAARESWAGPHRAAKKAATNPATSNATIAATHPIPPDHTGAQFHAQVSMPCAFVECGGVVCDPVEFDLMAMDGLEPST